MEGGDMSELNNLINAGATAKSDIVEGRVDDYDTFWAKIKYCLAGYIFLIGILEKCDMES